MDDELEEELLHAGIDAKTADWPESLKEKDPGPDAGPSKRRRWFRRNRQAAEALKEEEGEESDPAGDFLSEANERRTGGAE